MVFFIDEAPSRPPRLLTNVNKKMFFFLLKASLKGEVTMYNTHASSRLCCC